MRTPSPDLSAGVIVPINKVESELHRQLQAAMGNEGSPLQRARMSNLIVFCGHEAEAEFVNLRVPVLTELHPARIIVLIADQMNTEAEVSAEVRVTPLGQSRTTCLEQVILRVGGRKLDRLPFAVREILVGDLPTNLWWVSHQPPALAGLIFSDLSERVEQVIYDSLGWADPTHGVAATAPWITKFESQDRRGPSRVRVVSDLNWRRLKTWRKLVGQALDPVSAPGALRSITELTIEHGPHAVIQAWQLVSWLASRLGWKVRASKLEPNVEIDWIFDTHDLPVRVAVRRLSEGPAAITRLRLTCSIDSRPTCLDLHPERPHRLAAFPEGMNAERRTISVRELVPGELVGRQLSERERDPIFRQSMEVAQSLALSLLH